MPLIRIVSNSFRNWLAICWNYQNVTKFSISVNGSETSNFVTFQQIRNLDSHKCLVVLPA